MTGIFIIAAMSLNLLLGYTGQLSLGHVGFFGIGAYASALAAVGFDVDIFGHTFVHDPWPVPVAFAIGTAVAGLCGYLIGKLSFRVRGAYFVIVTVSFAEVIRIVAVNWVDLTQGPLAVTNIPPFAFALPALGRYTLYSKVSNYYLVLVVAIAAYVTIKRLVGSRIGRAMIALQGKRALAVSVGIDVTRYLVLAAVVSAALAGAAGSLYAHYIRIVDPDIFVFLYTVTMVIMVITGGQGDAGRSDRRRPHLRLRAGRRAFVREPGSAVDSLRRADDPGRLPAAAGHHAGRAGDCAATRMAPPANGNLDVLPDASQAGGR